MSCYFTSFLHTCFKKPKPHCSFNHSLFIGRATTAEVLAPFEGRLRQKFQKRETARMIYIKDPPVPVPFLHFFFFLSRTYKNPRCIQVYDNTPPERLISNPKCYLFTVNSRNAIEYNDNTALN